MVSAESTDKVVAHYVMYLHDFFLEDSIASVAPFVDKILIARTVKPWFGAPADMKKTDRTLELLQAQYGAKIEIHSGIFPDEHSQRNYLLEVSRQQGDKGAFIVDCDEVFLQGAFTSIYNFIGRCSPKALKIPYLTFIRHANLCVAPPYETGLFYVDLESPAHFTWARACSVEPLTMWLEEPAIAHFSYIRETDDDIMAKIRTFMHSGDTDWEQWFDKYYRNFDIRMRNFHPVCPSGWRHLRTFDLDALPPGLRSKLAEKGKLYDFTQDIPSPLPPQELHDRALCLVAEKRQGEATQALVNLVRLYPGYTPAHNDLALLYYDAGDRENALRHFEISNRRSPGRNAVLTNLANLYCETGEMEKAIDACREIVALNPRNTEALVRLGNLNSLAGKKGVALSFYTQALAITPDNTSARRGVSALGHP